MTRRRYVQIDGELYEVGADYVNAGAERVPVIGDRHYDGLRASDGTDIGTRARQRAYMRRYGLTTVDDYREQWRRDEARRIAVKHGYDPTRRGDMLRAIHQLETEHG